MQKSSILALVSLVALAATAAAQCPDWSTAGGFPGARGTVYAQCVWDDGNGPALYIGGEFDLVDDVAASRLAKWDGAQWTAVGGGLDGEVHALHVWDDGTGSALYVGGSFESAGGVAARGIAKWDGASFSPLGAGLVGTDASARAIQAFDDGGGEMLYVGGRYDDVGGVGGNIARWDGSQWRATSFLNDRVEALEVHEDGSGRAIYAAGRFTQPARRVARWNGTTWLSVGSHPDDIVADLISFDYGTGPRLIATFEDGVWAWSGGGWARLGPSGLMTDTLSLAVLDEGAGLGRRLYAGAGGPIGSLRFARWDGSQWTELGWTNGEIRTIAAYGDGADGRGRVWLGGSFSQAEERIASGVVRWTGTDVVPISNALAARAHALAAHTDAAGPALFAATNDHFADSSRIVRRDEFGWRHFADNEIGGGVEALMTWNDGGTETLVAVGSYYATRGIARLLPSGHWQAYDNGLVGDSYNSVVHVAFAHDEGNGPRLFAAGSFQRFETGSTVLIKNVARFDGSRWRRLGTGTDGPVRALCDYGGDLIAGGSFASAGGVAASSVARWDGTAWSPLGAGLAGDVRALAIAAEDGQTVLYAGGSIALAGGRPLVHLARFDGAAWQAVGGGLDGPVEALRVFDDGAGPALFVAGDFELAGGVPASRIARWNGVAWSSPGGGADDVVEHLAAVDLGTGPELWLGGKFTRAGGSPSFGVATWKGCEEVGVPFCFGDGSGTACPCGNSGAPGRGCASSFDPAGALLEARGLASVSHDGLVLEGSSTSSSIVTYFQGTTRANGGAGSVFGDGLRCAGGTTLRLGGVQAVGGSSSYPSGAALPISVRGTIPPTGGVTRTYQVWFRNAASFCTPSTFNLSNGVEIAWTY